MFEQKETVSEHFDIIVIGAGAAGLTAAIFAAESGAAKKSGEFKKSGTAEKYVDAVKKGKTVHQGSESHSGLMQDSCNRDLKVLILERTPQAGRKILMSGGTRCNVLPVNVSLDDFVTESSPNRLRNIFKSWSLERCHQWFQEDIGLEMACEQSSEKWFPKSNSAKEVRDLLVKRFLDLGGSIRYGASVNSISKIDDITPYGSQGSTGSPCTLKFSDGKSQAEWIVKNVSGEHYHSSHVIIASGGMSVPSTGTDGTGHRITQKLGHSLNATYPALTPLMGSHPGSEPLPGVSLDVNLTIDGKEKYPFKSRRNGFLFTHQGYSGPAVLDVSHMIVKALDSGNAPPVLRVNWTGKNEEWWLKQLEGKQTVQALLKKHLPNRLVVNMLEGLSLAEKKTAQLSKQERVQLLKLLTAYQLVPTGHMGYKKAEVTGGGVPLDEINPATMESRITEGLYLCGEILDVFGRIGGYNFYWAWVSGRLAGISAGKSVLRS